MRLKKAKRIGLKKAVMGGCRKRNSLVPSPTGGGWGTSVQLVDHLSIVCEFTFYFLYLNESVWSKLYNLRTQVYLFIPLTHKLNLKSRTPALSQREREYDRHFKEEILVKSTASSGLPLRLLLVLLLFFTLFSGVANSQTTPNHVPFQGTFSQEYSPKDRALKVSEPVELRFKFTHSIDAQIIPPETLPTQRWHIVSTSTEEKGLNKSEQETTLNMTVSVNRPGATTLPPLKFIVLDRSGSSAEITGSPISIKFISILPDTIDLAFKPPKPPVEIWIENFTLAWIAGLGLIAGLFLALFMFMKNRRVMIEIPKPPRAAHDIALEKLASVAGQEISDDSEKNMAFYVLISEAIREYMGSIWNFPGTELTTTEILQHLREKVFPLGISQDDIGNFLKETDYVKFAGSKPDNESNARILRRAFSIIELTKTLSLSQYTTDLTQFRELYGGDATEDQDAGPGQLRATVSQAKPNELNPEEPPILKIEEADLDIDIQDEDIKNLENQ